MRRIKKWNASGNTDSRSKIRPLIPVLRALARDTIIFTDLLHRVQFIFGLLSGNNARTIREPFLLLFQYTDLGHTTYPNLAKTVFAIFMVLVPILLLNMLIAMMGNTYAHVIEQSEKEWVKQVNTRRTTLFLLHYLGYYRNDGLGTQVVLGYFSIPKLYVRSSHRRSRCFSA